MTAKELQLLDKKQTAQERAKRLAVLIGMTGLKRRAFCQKYGLSENTLKVWENASIGGGLTEKGAKKVLALLREAKIEATLPWLLYGTGEPPRIVKLHESTPFEEKLLGETNLLSSSEISIEEEIEFYCTKNQAAIVFMILDDAMEPFYYRGDYVGGKSYPIDKIKNLIGRDCVVKIADGTIVCRRLAHGNKESHFNLLPLNPNGKAPQLFFQDVQIIEVAPATRIWRPEVNE